MMEKFTFAMTAHDKGL